MKRTTLGLILACTAFLAGGATVPARAEPVCAAPSELTRAGFGLPRLAKSLEDKTPTTILVLNSSATVEKKPAKSTGAAKDAVPKRFPSYIEEILRARYPDGGIVVATQNQPRATAQAILTVLPDLLRVNKPSLLIWQTGTYDAILGVDTGAFGDAVSDGVRLAHEAKTDVILVGPQYSPRTSVAFDVAPYTNTLQWTARGNAVPFFDRYDVMRYWQDEGIFDLDADRPSPTLFDDVHGCIGRLLVGMIADGVDKKTLGSR
ncbi:SGNH/GDSL hydrolase family protein [Ancylobacter sp. Lp-2]|uniref:SGNH/GDSL hydrolase family protein n=1 Tax=Ancylobacter sp. Lp-2 TaxID=2881339 RepID=UPI001E471284|nr:SGNH/GDSL hydrolase family protein [Ancylobacter sp. Lp-2]